MRSQTSLRTGLQSDLMTFALASPYSQSWEFHSPKEEGLTVPGAPSRTSRGEQGRARRLAPHPYRLRTWGDSRMSRPECAPTAEIFADIPGYLQYLHVSSQEQNSDCDEDTREQDHPSPLKRRRERSRLRESARGKWGCPGGYSIAPSNPKLKATLPPEGTMRCLWGDGCTVQMDFDYTIETIKVWKNHIISHLATSNRPTEGSGGRARMVRCSWDGCTATVERGYLFKHIVTHEVRFKLQCPHGCGVAIRDDNLERHLRSCAIYRR